MMEQGTQDVISRTVVDLESVSMWPTPLLAYLDAHHDVFLDWANGPVRVDAATYDRAIYGLIDVLQPYAIVGWHCTRLTDREIAAIVADGMQLPDTGMLARRINTVAEEGLLTAGMAERLRSKNQAHEPNRAGMIWFCFFPPRLAGEGGIGSLLRFWGGEALYNSHNRHPGEPCDHEDSVRQPLPANCIYRVISFPHPYFLALSACGLWHEPLTSGNY